MVKILKQYGSEVADVHRKDRCNQYTINIHIYRKKKKTIHFR